MRAVHFGAGNIGRGFIGLLLSQAGYRVTFVDVNEALVASLNEAGQYRVRYANADEETFTVRGIDALPGRDIGGIVGAMLSADLVTTAVGVHVLPYIAPAIAEAVKERAKRDLPILTVVACENAVRASSMLRQKVLSLLSVELAGQLGRLACFPDAAVDRIVPLQQHGDSLLVTVEPFYEWTIDASKWPEQMPRIPNVHYTVRLEAYIERKLFTVNTGHLAAAYLGYLRGCATIQEAMSDPFIKEQVAEALQESGAALIARHGFNLTEHQSYIDQTLERFQNRYLSDDIARVGRSPIRKLAPNDRLLRPAELAWQYGISVKALPKVMAAALLFQADGDEEAVALRQHLLVHGAEGTLAHFTGLAEDHPLLLAAVGQYRQLQTGKQL